MLRLKRLNRNILTLLLFMCMCKIYKAQDLNKDIYKTYGQCDSLSLNQGGTLILYADNSFLNFGILKDLANQEVYVWYTSGKWSANGNNLSCNSTSDVFKTKDIIDEIKFRYKKRRDYRLVDSYYEFVNERYKNYQFVLNANKASDTVKKIEYTETKISLNN